MLEAKEYNLAGIRNSADLLQWLQNGHRFCSLSTYRDGTKNLDTVIRADSRYIYWKHYGESANAATAKELDWIITVIFKTDLDGFIRRFVWVW